MAFGFRTCNSKKVGLEKTSVGKESKEASS